MRTIGSARTALTTAAGMSRNAIWRSPVLTVARNPSMSPRVANRDSDGKRTVAMATEKNPLREHVHEERLPGSPSGA